MLKFHVMKGEVKTSSFLAKKRSGLKDSYAVLCKNCTIVWPLDRWHWDLIK